MATVRFGCFSLMNNSQRSADGNLKHRYLQRRNLNSVPSERFFFPGKRVCYKYKHSGEYRLDKTHRNFANSFKLVISSILEERSYCVKNATFNSFVDGIRFLTSNFFLQ